MAQNLKVNSDLNLKTLELSDAPTLFKLTDKNRTYLRQWLGWLDRTKEVSDTEGFIKFSHQQRENGTAITFGIWLKNELIGVADFHGINKAYRSALIGYWISKEHAGRGYARAVTKALINYGFQELNLHRIEIRCASENIASQKVAEACGLQFEGLSRDYEWLYDHFVDHKVYAILSTDTPPKS